jgi:hypothetical protein
VEATQEGYFDGTNYDGNSFLLPVLNVPRHRTYRPVPHKPPSPKPNVQWMVRKEVKGMHIDIKGIWDFMMNIEVVVLDRRLGICEA